MKKYTVWIILAVAAVAFYWWWTKKKAAATDPIKNKPGTISFGAIGTGAQATLQFSGTEPRGIPKPIVPTPMNYGRPAVKPPVYAD